jgi:hypothetical protein
MAILIVFVGNMYITATLNDTFCLFSFKM